MDPLTPRRRVVIDASVVLGLLDSQDPLHRPASDTVAALRQDDTEIVLPSFVLAEVLIGVGAFDIGAIELRRDQLEAAVGPAFPVDGRVATAAAHRCAESRSMRLPEALLLGTADVVGAEQVLTGDARLAAIDPRVRVIGR